MGSEHSAYTSGRIEAQREPGTSRAIPIDTLIDRGEMSRAHRTDSQPFRIPSFYPSASMEDQVSIHSMTDKSDDFYVVDDVIFKSGSCLAAARYVSTTGTDAVNDCTDPDAPCLTIQHAVDVACAGDVIDVAAGIYPQQVAITKPLTIQGAGKDVTFVQPTAVIANTTNLTTAVPVAAIMLVDGANEVNIYDLTVNGAPGASNACTPNYVGIYYRNASGMLGTVHVTNIFHSSVFCQNEVAVFAQSGAGGSSNLTVQNSLMDMYGKDGIACSGMETECLVLNNIVTGRGPVPNGDAAQNGIQFVDAAGSIIENTVTANYYLPQTFCATGIVLFSDSVFVQGNILTGNLCDLLALTNSSVIEGNSIDPALDFPLSIIGNSNVVSGNVVSGSPNVAVYNDGTSNTYSCNRITNNNGGFLFDSSFNGTGSGDGTPNTLFDNFIANNGVGVDATAIDPSLPEIAAPGNWWGCAAGPGSAGCDTVTANVDASEPLATPPACVLCESDAACNDSNMCTTDSCDRSLGQCVFTQSVDCSTPPGPCLDTGECISDTGLCFFPLLTAGEPCIPQPPDPCCSSYTCNPDAECVSGCVGQRCDDGDACTDDSCDPDVGCSHVRASCKDENDCTFDSCDSMIGCIFMPTPGESCDDGDPCTDNDACTIDSTCEGAVFPCDDRNDCTTDSCDMARGCAHENNTDPCDDGDACTTADTCGDGSCNGGSAPVCDDKNGCTIDSCDSTTGCVYTPTPGESCNDGSACTEKDTCTIDGACEGTVITCDDTNDCTTDSCDPALGCHYEPDVGDSCYDGNACTDNDTCTIDSTCEGEVLICDDRNDCTTDSCDFVSGCANKNNTDLCDDGDACTTADTCGSGSCIGGPAPDCDDRNGCTIDSCDLMTGCGHTNAVGGTSCGDPSDSPCDHADSCDASGNCATNNEPDGTSCSDGLFCNGDETCVNGLCTQGTPPPGPCCKNDAECDDENVCNGTESCVNNACSLGAPLDCNDNNDCTTDSCDFVSGCANKNNTDLCDDGDACTTADTCAGGSCNGGPAPDCDDRNGCTLDSCDLMSGCVYTPTPSEPCTDGNSCTEADTCTIDGDCEGTIVTCDDTNGCTTDSCNPVSGCHYAPDSGEPCNDGSFCTDNDVCSPMGMCVGVLILCDDLNDCTIDTCDPQLGCLNSNAIEGASCGSSTDSTCDHPDACDGSGTCVPHAEPDGTPCADGVFCDGDEFCSGGICGRGTPIPDCCDSNSQCENSDLCDGMATCMRHTCDFGLPLNCDDNNDCTDDSCDSSMGCQYVNNSISCDDDDDCTQNDICVDGGCAGHIRPYGDISPPGGDGIVNLEDITCVLNGFSQISDCPDADLAPCAPNENGIVTIDDILSVLAAFSGTYYCPHPCQP